MYLVKLYHNLLTDEKLHDTYLHVNDSVVNSSTTTAFQEASGFLVRQGKKDAAAWIKEQDAMQCSLPFAEKYKFQLVCVPLKDAFRLGVAVIKAVQAVVPDPSNKSNTLTKSTKPIKSTKSKPNLSTSSSASSASSAS